MTIKKMQEFDVPAITEVDENGLIHIDTPAGAKIYRLSGTGSSVRAWALVNPAVEVVTRDFFYVETDVAFDRDGVSYVGTIVSNDPEVPTRHLFEQEE